MTDPAYLRRFERQANANPQAFAGYTEAKLGVPPFVAMQMLAIHRSLVDGNKISPAQTRQLQAAHPDTPAHHIADLIGKLNACSPGERPNLYLGILAGDQSVITGDFANAGPVFAELSAFAKTYHTQSIADDINARREARADPELQARTIERPKPEALSARALIEAQIDGQDGKDARYIAGRLEEGDPDMLRAVAGNLADRGEAAMEVLDKPGPDTSLRDTISAAASFHEVEQIAADQGLVSQEQA